MTEEVVVVRTSKPCVPFFIDLLLIIFSLTTAIVFYFKGNLLEHDDSSLHKLSDSDPQTKPKRTHFALIVLGSMLAQILFSGYLLMLCFTGHYNSSWSFITIRIIMLLTLLSIFIYLRVKYVSKKDKQSAPKELQNFAMTPLVNKLKRIFK